MQLFEHLSLGEMCLREARIESEHCIDARHGEAGPS
jgi:hypothetical protein